MDWLASLRVELRFFSSAHSGGRLAPRASDFCDHAQVVLDTLTRPYQRQDFRPILGAYSVRWNLKEADAK